MKHNEASIDLSVPFLQEVAWVLDSRERNPLWILGSQGQNSLQVPEFSGTKPIPGSGLPRIDLTLGSEERNPLWVPGSGERNPLWVPDSQERNPPRVPDSQEQNPPRVPGSREQNPLLVQDSRKRHLLQVSGSRERNPLWFRVPENGTHPGFRGTQPTLRFGFPETEPEPDTPIRQSFPCQAFLLELGAQTTCAFNQFSAFMSYYKCISLTT